MVLNSDNIRDGYIVRLINCLAIYIYRVHRRDYVYVRLYVYRLTIGLVRIRAEND